MVDGRGLSAYESVGGVWMSSEQLATGTGKHAEGARERKAKTTSGWGWAFAGIFFLAPPFERFAVGASCLLCVAPAGAHVRTAYPGYMDSVSSPPAFCGGTPEGPIALRLWGSTSGLR